MLRNLISAIAVSLLTIAGAQAYDPAPDPRMSRSSRPYDTGPTLGGSPRESKTRQSSTRTNRSSGRRGEPQFGGKAKKQTGYQRY